MKKILGLDLGTNSIGWALINSDSENNNNKNSWYGFQNNPHEPGYIERFYPRQLHIANG